MRAIQCSLSNGALAVRKRAGHSTLFAACVPQDVFGRADRSRTQVDSSTPFLPGHFCFTHGFWGDIRRPTAVSGLWGWLDAVRRTQVQHNARGEGGSHESQSGPECCCDPGSGRICRLRGSWPARAGCRRCGRGRDRSASRSTSIKMKAGWIGQMAGVGWGGPTEFRYKGVIMPEDKMPPVGAAPDQPVRTGRHLRGNDLPADAGGPRLRRLDPPGGHRFRQQRLSSLARQQGRAGQPPGRHRTAGFGTPAVQQARR